jgi:hypothetical protein
LDDSLDLSPQEAMRRRFVKPTREVEDAARWRAATAEERGEALLQLLELVSAIGNVPEKRDRFPGFPRP